MNIAYAIIVRTIMVRALVVDILGILLTVFVGRAKNLLLLVGNVGIACAMAHAFGARVVHLTISLPCVMKYLNTAADAIVITPILRAVKLFIIVRYAGNPIIGGGHVLRVKNAGNLITKDCVRFSD